MTQQQRCKYTKVLFSTVLTILLLVPTLALAAAPERISVTAAHQAFLAGEPVTFIDTRTQAEWHQAPTMLPEALRVYTQDDLQRVMNQLPKEQLIIPYCT